MKLSPLAAVFAIASSACTDHAAPTRTGGFAIDGADVRIDGDHIRMLPAGQSWHLGVRTVSIAGEPLADPHLASTHDSATLLRGGVQEWYRRVPGGLEHGYDIAERPRAPLTVTIELGGFEARPSSDDTLDLHDAHGIQRMRYGKLAAWDADGDVLPTRIDGAGPRITLHVDDAGADYPVHIDPTFWVLQDVLLPPDTDDYFFAKSLALSGDTAVVGHDYDEVNGNLSAGSAYVFTFGAGSWTQQQKISGVSTGDALGTSVDIDGDWLVAGAPGSNTPVSNAGVAHVHERIGGVFTNLQALAPADGVGDAAGTAVALRGDLLAIGAPLDDDVANDAGAVYVYRRDVSDVWQLEDKLVAPNGASFDRLGEAVAVDSDTVVAAADSHNTSGVDNSGAVYVFRHDGSNWAHEQTIVSSYVKEASSFGRDVALGGDTLIIGQVNGGGVMPFIPGTAYVWTRSGSVWSQQAEIQAANGVYGDLYGAAVAYHADVAVVGANRGNSDFGVATVWRRSGVVWTEEASLLSPTPVVYDEFGESVAVGAGRAFVGARYDDTLALDAGAAFMFALVGNVCLTQAECASGTCVDGYCCNTACNGGCSRCDAPGLEGECTALLAGDLGACSPGMCDGTSFDCEPCDGDDECIQDHYCSMGTCLPRAADGESCADASVQCLSGQCVDEVCCDSPCAEQCRACDVAGSEGTCSVVMGAPHEGRAPCDEDFCDASEHIAYAGFSCRGGDVCEPDTINSCKPYSCGDITCRADCLSDAHCIVEGEECYLPENECRPTDPVCDGDYLLILPDGSQTSCLPFRCTPDGGCFSQCTSSAQCGPGHACDTEGRCVEPPRAIDLDKVCSCRVVGAPTPSWWPGVLSLCALWAMRRRGADRPKTERRRFRSAASARR